MPKTLGAGEVGNESGKLDSTKLCEGVSSWVSGVGERVGEGVQGAGVFAAGEAAEEAGPSASESDETR